MAEKIKKLLVTVPLEEFHLNRLREHLDGAEIIQCRHSDRTAVGEALKVVDAAVISGRVDERFYTAPNLKWVHADAAGLDSSAKAALFESGLIVTNSAGRSAPALAEHTLFFMLRFAYRIRALRAAQSEKSWGYEGQEGTHALFAQTIGILGLGNTGIALAQRAKAFGMNVLAYRRRNAPKPDSVDTLYTEENGDTLDALLRESDFIAVTTPLNNKTYHMIGERELKLMKRTAVIANLGRGACIDENALIAALKSGEIAGAGLDTFETEPLPSDSALWTLDNVLLTPHFTPPCPDKVGRSLDIVIDNIIRFQKGETLRNVLTPDDIFDLPL